jgi:hypothetical protein
VPAFQNNSASGSDSIGGLVVVSQFTVSGKTEYLIDTASDPIVVLNGAVLFNGVEYSAITNNGNPYVKLSFTPLPNQVLTLAYINGGQSDDLYADVYTVGVIKSGATGTQLYSDTIFYNISTERYEYYLDSPPWTDVILSVNGSTLAEGLEFVMSSSVPNRLILTETIKTGDIISAFYTPSNPVVGIVNTNTPVITWSIAVAPTNINGAFTIEVVDSEDEFFTNILYMTSVSYVVGLTVYSKIISLSNASAGDKFLYRIKNEKKYIPIKGYIILSTVYSESFLIEIGTNQNINY